MIGRRRAARNAGPPEQQRNAPQADPAQPDPEQPRPKPGPPTGSIPMQPAGQSKRPRRGSRGGSRRRRKRGSLPQTTIVFIGPMAAGKTSLGRRVARELGVRFVDSDAVFTAAHGNIVDFFAARGEEEFRRIEAQIIADELSKSGARILALGGGAVLTDSTRELLRDQPVVLLMTTQEAVLRTANLDRRPLLKNDPEAWGRILEARLPLYEEVANITYRTDRGTKDQLARRIANWVRSYPKK